MNKSETKLIQRIGELEREIGRLEAINNELQGRIERANKALTLRQDARADAKLLREERDEARRQRDLLLEVVKGGDRVAHAIRKEMKPDIPF